jgi:hypothetical protein
MIAGDAPFAFTEWRQRVGIEREFKWSFGLDEAERFLAGRSMDRALAEIELPAGFRAHARNAYSHQQQTAYLDDEWRLLDNEASLAIVINQGPTGEQCYLKTKQTIGWHGLRRDAVELAERVPAAEMSTVVAHGEALPIAYLTRQFGAMTLRPFARTVQQRWKLNIYSRREMPMVVCWDECAIAAVGLDVSETAHCVEVETNMLDNASCDELAELADAVTKFVGMPANNLSKSRRAAALCGCRSAA